MKNILKKLIIGLIIFFVLSQGIQASNIKNDTRNDETSTLDGNIEWHKTFGGIEDEVGNDIQQTRDGGFVIVGTTYTYPEYEICSAYVLKTDSNGEKEWDRFYLSGITSNGICIKQTWDGGYIFLAEKSHDVWYGEVALWLVKIDENGEKEWEEEYYEDGKYCYGTALEICPQGGFLIAGIIDHDFNSQTSFVIKVDDFGNVEWMENFGKIENSDCINSLALTDDGGYIAAGTSFDSSGEETWKAWIIKLDSSGHTEWELYLETQQETSINDIQQTSDGGFVLTGKTHPEMEFEELVLLKTDPYGIVEWEQVYEGPLDVAISEGHSVRQTRDDGYIVSGYSYRPTNPLKHRRQIWIIKTDLNGYEEWDEIIGGEDNDEGKAVRLTSDGGYIITGYEELIHHDDPYELIQQDITLIKIVGEEEGFNLKFDEVFYYPNPPYENELIEFQGLLNEVNEYYESVEIALYLDGNLVDTTRYEQGSWEFLVSCTWPGDEDYHDIEIVIDPNNEFENEVDKSDNTWRKSISTPRSRSNFIFSSILYQFLLDFFNHINKTYGF